MKDIELMSVKEKVDYFREVVTNIDNIRGELNPVLSYEQGFPQITINTNFFILFSNHPKYQHIVGSILDSTYQRWINSGNHTVDSYCYLMASIFNSCFEVK